MPDPVLGERTCAFVVPRRGQRVTLPELVHHLAEAGIARFKLPERVELVDELPLSPFGKVSAVPLPPLGSPLRAALGRFSFPVHTVPGGGQHVRGWCRACPSD
ncbi:MAG: hypothetical protein HY728_09930 [Candidatus Rokubacteria bacterium]|nr:hypothetical protein [Candidatus Rokubacteria bacterium]